MSAPTIDPLATAGTEAAKADGQGAGGGVEEWAICCSGGGIRSASYCLGALQRIGEDRVLASGSQISLDKVTMIVGVSGGSYITASRAVVANGPGLSVREPAYAPGTPEEQHLRDNTNYLVPDAKTLLAGVLSLLFGVATTLLLFLTPLFAVSHAWGWLLRSWGALKYTTAAHTVQVTAAVTGTTSIVPAIAAGVTFLAFLWWWYTLKPNPGGQERHSQVAVTVLGWLAFLTLVLAVATLAVPELIAWLAGPHSGALKTVLDNLGFGAGAAWTPAALGGFVAAVVAVAQMARKSVAAYEQLTAPASKPTSSQQSSSSQPSAVLTYLRALVMPWLASVLILLAGFIVALRWVKDGAAAGFNRDQLWLVIGALAVMLVTRLLADVNRISLHDFYRWRLATAYAVQRDPTSSSGIKNVPGALLSDLAGQQPTPVLCTTANINARREVPVGRGGLSFTFDPDLATLRGPGPEEKRDAKTRDYEILVGERRFTLFDVSAISGAAFSPLMGVATRQAYRILFTAANLRLGVWLPHPAVVHAAREALDAARKSKDQRDKLSWWRALGLLFWYELPHPSWRLGNDPKKKATIEAREARLWAHVLNLREDGKGFQKFLGGLLYHALQPTLGLLYAEAAGHTSYRSTWMCVTDGGHYDNLGVIEALQRKARRILVLDASGDKANTWFTIGGAIAQARSDARTEIELKPQTMCEPSTGLMPGEVVTPSVSGNFTRYPLSDPSVSGQILVCKLGWWKDAPWDIRAYAAGHENYPTDSTIEQLYDSAEFDAYRELGTASVELTIKNGELKALIT